MMTPYFPKLLIVCLLGVIFLFPSLMLAQEEPCVGRPECYEPPPDINPVVDNINSPAPNAIWEGFTDRSLSPEFDEYYSVWCQDDVIQVLRGVPETAWIDDISLAKVMALGDGGTFETNNGVHVSRVGDGITLAGTNGNLSPQYGSKSFSLAQCIERNGGEPEPTPRALYANLPPPPPDDDPCDNSDLEICTDPSLGYLPWLIMALLTFCFPNLAGGFVMLIWYRST
jgi:hypothetical protein